MKDRIDNRFVIISGCSGGGKSTLLEELARRGHATVTEPGRRIVIAEAARGGRALPWVDATAFARRLVSVAAEDLERARTMHGTVFFDRSLIDAAAALAHLGDGSALEKLGTSTCFHRRVFLAPPWLEIFGQDAERRHSLADAIAEYERLSALYPKLGYETVVLPKVDVATRADYVLRALGIIHPPI
jgi:predicted ATPase